ncbi:YcgN family cysteine cluster protein [Methylovulum miyakonense]|uniref:YcgN family cysteine cluster protein n=1 Tax=Methylovulum miyakonense TaxID=645578 RepID=UPI00037E5BB3|nr:YcgN family cysteine cluster protein [Methylovulum miyakonense]
MGFWHSKKLAEMSHEEWESLCDGCGQCCLHKLEDEDTGEVALTRIACDLLDLKTCRCTNYGRRVQLVSECLDLRQRDFAGYHHWLPKTCAYRLVGEGKDLPEWHPLVSGTKNSVKAAGMSVSHYALKASTLKPSEDYEDHIIEWLD